MIKTLIFDAGGQIVAALVRGDHEVNPEKLTQLVGGVHIELANEEAIRQATGANVGFAGPIGLAGRVSKMIIDHAVAAMAVGVTGANKTDYHTRNVVPGRDFPLEGDNVVVADVRLAVPGDTHDGVPVQFKRGIEVGQVFKLGTKYSKKLGANYKDEAGELHPCLMGCYGIGINRIMASAIELYNDENGIIWPISIAPFEVIVTPVNQDDPDVVRVADELYRKLTDAGIEVLLDDRDLRGGIKFKDADLIGIPIRVTVGKKSVVEGNVEVKLRAEKDSSKTRDCRDAAEGDRAGEFAEGTSQGVTGRRGRACTRIAYARSMRIGTLPHPTKEKTDEGQPDDTQKPDPQRLAAGGRNRGEPACRHGRRGHRDRQDRVRRDQGPDQSVRQPVVLRQMVAR